MRFAAVFGLIAGSYRLLAPAGDVAAAKATYKEVIAAGGLGGTDGKEQLEEVLYLSSSSEFKRKRFRGAVKPQSHGGTEVVLETVTETASSGADLPPVFAEIPATLSEEEAAELEAIAPVPADNADNCATIVPQVSAEPVAPAAVETVDNFHNVASPEASPAKPAAKAAGKAKGKGPSRTGQ